MPSDPYRSGLIKSIPGHVRNRVDQLLALDIAAGQVPEVVVGDFVKDDKGICTGTVVAFTSELVAVAHMVQSPFSEDVQLGASSVAVEVFPRASLVEMRLAQTAANADDTWEVTGTWPTRSVITLRYAGGHDLELRVDPGDAEQNTRLERLLAALPKDLVP